MKKILVLQAARFGDLVQTGRLISSLRADHEVHICVDQNLTPLARILYPEVEIHGFSFHGRQDRLQPDTVAAEMQALLEHAYAKIYNCNFSRLNATLCRIFPAESIVCYRPADNSEGGIERSSWARLVMRLSRMRHFTSLNLVDFWAWLSPAPISPQLVNPVAVPGGKGVGIALAGREARRSLPTSVLAAIVKIVVKIVSPARLILLGSSAEAPRARALARELPATMQGLLQDRTGKTDWSQLTEQIRGLDLLLTPDTGIMHLAASQGTPVMAFFLSSAWVHETGPYGLGHVIWQSVAPCSPCLENAPCTRNLQCLLPFKTPEFARALALFLQGEKKVPLPEGLQCWQSGLDDLGAQPRLLAGEDGHAQARKTVRALLKEKLGIEAGDVRTLPMDKRNILIEELFTESEWMLPPWRYC